MLIFLGILSARQAFISFFKSKIFIKSQNMEICMIEFEFV